MEKKKILTREEEADEIIRRLATPPEPPISDFQRVIIPMIRKIVPQMMAHEIIGVQPMTGFNLKKDKE